VECIDNCGTPRSIVLMPKFAELMGPIVDPQARSLLLLNNW